MSRKDCFVGRRDEKHLFACPVCRADARLARGWKGLAPPASLETPAPVDELFVKRILGAVRRDRARAIRRRTWAAAVAALLFFFFAGLAHETASTPAVTAEESYAAIVSPSSLDGLIPN
jgi:hypothetical protein